jgi:hypothetical protein
MKDKNRMIKGNQYVVSLKELYQCELLRWYCNYLFVQAESKHSAGCVIYFPDAPKIKEICEIYNKGQCHLALVKGPGDEIASVGNTNAPVRSISTKQEEYYETLGKLIDELGVKYFYNQPDPILLVDFNLPLCLI